SSGDGLHASDQRARTHVGSAVRALSHAPPSRLSRRECRSLSSSSGKTDSFLWSAKWYGWGAPCQANAKRSANRRLAGACEAQHWQVLSRNAAKEIGRASCRERG